MGPLKSLRQRWWLVEWLAFVGCAACLALLGIVFYYFDGRPQPELPLGMTVHSLASILSEPIKFCLDFILGSVLQQLAVLWFERARPLKDLKHFDRAGWNPSALVRFLWRQIRKGPSWVGTLACSAALLISFHYSIGFFLQQSVTSQPGQVDAGQALLPRTVQDNDFAPGVTPLLGSIDIRMEAAINNGLYNKDASIFKVPSVCPTGNCSFPLWQTLAVGSACKSLDSEIQTRCQNETGTQKCTYSVPNEGLEIDGYNVSLGLRGILNNSLFSEYPQQLVTFEVLASEGINNAPVSAFGCALYLKVDTYHSKILNGVVEEEIVSTFLNSTPLAAGQTDWLIMPPNSTDGIFKMTSKSVLPKQNYLFQAFTGVERGGSGQPSYTGSEFTRIIASTFRAGELPDRIQNVATMMTNVERIISFARNGTKQPVGEDANAAFGTAHSAKSLVHIRWAWFLTMPIILLTLDLIVLGTVMAMVKTRKMQRIESGSLAWIEAGPSDDGRGQLLARHGDSSVTSTAGEAYYYFNRSRFWFVK